MRGIVLAAAPDSAGAGAALDTKRLALAWLLGGVAPPWLSYVHLRLSPSTVASFAPFETALGFVCAALFFLWKWPGVWRLSRLRPQASDLAIGVLAGYVCWNVVVILPSVSIAWPWLPSATAGLRCPHLKALFVCHVLVVPLAEELIFRAVILGSLSRRIPALWAVLITAAAATMVHTGTYAFLPQAVLCTVYLARRRSIPASVAAHATMNALVWFPGLLVG